MPALCVVLLCVMANDREPRLYCRSYGTILLGTLPRTLPSRERTIPINTAGAVPAPWEIADNSIVALVLLEKTLHR